MDSYSAPKKTKRVGDLFSKYKKTLRPPQASVEKACQKAILSSTGQKLDLNQISYNVNSRTISLNTPSIIKTEIKFKQSEIIKMLEKELGAKSTPKIIF